MAPDFLQESHNQLTTTLQCWAKDILQNMGPVLQHQGVFGKLAFKVLHRHAGRDENEIDTVARLRSLFWSWHKDQFKPS